MIKIIDKDGIMTEFENVEFSNRELNKVKEMIRLIDRRRIICEFDIKPRNHVVMTLLKEIAFILEGYEFENNGDYCAIHYENYGQEDLETTFDKINKIKKEITEIDTFVESVLERKNKQKSIWNSKLRTDNVCPYCIKVKTIKRVCRETDAEEENDSTKYECMSCGKQFNLNVVTNIINLIDPDPDKIKYFRYYEQRINTEATNIMQCCNNRRQLPIDVLSVKFGGNNNFLLFVTKCFDCFTYGFYLNKSFNNMKTKNNDTETQKINQISECYTRPTSKHESDLNMGYNKLPNIKKRYNTLFLEMQKCQ